VDALVWALTELFPSDGGEEAGAGSRFLVAVSAARHGWMAADVGDFPTEIILDVRVQVNA
jgi:hypothetical protein